MSNENIEADTGENIGLAHVLKAMLAEIKKQSGLTLDALAESFSSTPVGGITISHAMMRKYAAGLKSVSRSRVIAIAMLAQKRNWAGPRCADVINEIPAADQEWFGFDRDDYESISKSLKKIGVANKRSKKNALANLKKALKGVASHGVSDIELMYAATMLIQKIIPVDEQSGGGGIVDPRWLPLPLEGDHHQEPVWIETTIQPWHAKIMEP